jgi:hypothetical protein
MITINATMIDGKIIPSRDLTEEEKSTIISSYFLGQSYVHYQIGDEDLVSARERALEILTMDINSDPSSIDTIITMMQDHGDQYLEEYMIVNHPDNNPFNP